MKVNFLDKERKIISLDISIRDTIFFLGHLNYNPNTLAQEKLIKIWKKYHDQPFSEEAEKEITDTVESIRLENSEAENRFSSTYLKGRELWKVLYGEIEGFSTSQEYCKRLQAIFDAMEWSYYFAKEVDVIEYRFSRLKIGGRLVFCDKLENMKSVAFEYLKENWYSQWRVAMENKLTDLGFEDWCERLCINDAWTEVLDREDGIGKKIEVGGTIYWVGR